MTWHWRYEDRDGTPRPGDGSTFPSQADAETWLGEAWRDLLADGVAQVTLLEDERQVYGPMSLEPPA